MMQYGRNMLLFNRITSLLNKRTSNKILVSDMVYALIKKS